MSKFSIVIPALNEEKYLPNLLTSLTKQTRTDYEVVVVDGSSKGTLLHDGRTTLRDRSQHIRR